MGGSFPNSDAGMMPASAVETLSVSAMLCRMRLKRDSIDMLGYYCCANHSATADRVALEFEEKFSSLMITGLPAGPICIFRLVVFYTT